MKELISNILAWAMIISFGILYISFVASVAMAFFCIPLIGPISGIAVVILGLGIPICMLL